MVLSQSIDPRAFLSSVLSSDNQNIMRLSEVDVASTSSMSLDANQPSQIMSQQGRSIHQIQIWSDVQFPPIQMRLSVIQMAPKRYSEDTVVAMVDLITPPSSPRVGDVSLDMPDIAGDDDEVDKEDIHEKVDDREEEKSSEDSSSSSTTGSSSSGRNSSGSSSESEEKKEVSIDEEKKKELR